jgi:hypothetical protein
LCDVGYEAVWYTAFKKEVLEIFLNIRFFSKMTFSNEKVQFSKFTFVKNNVMDALPLEFFNFTTDVQPFKISPNFWE